jgi:uncharacterized Zn-finger protein
VPDPAPRPAVPPSETIAVDSDADEVCCDGGGALGHPRVWYSLDGRNQVICQYCDRAFVKKPASA